MFLARAPGWDLTMDLCGLLCLDDFRFAYYKASHTIKKIEPLGGALETLFRNSALLLLRPPGSRRPRAGAHPRRALVPAESFPGQK